MEPRGFVVHVYHRNVCIEMFSSVCWMQRDSLLPERPPSSRSLSLRSDMNFSSDRHNGWEVSFALQVRIMRTFVYPIVRSC